VTNYETTALADRFADLACLTYGGDHVSRRQQAEAMLAATPDIGAATPYAAATAFDAAAIHAYLQADAGYAARAGGPRTWPPLMYVCYSRTTENPPHRDAMTCARLLLEAGAPADAFIVDERIGGWRWSSLTGAMGEGENGLLQQPPHARARELAELLLAHGADPNDGQGLYNTMFTPGNEWLELLLAHGLSASDTVDPDRDGTRTLDYQLSQAVKRGLHVRAKMLLQHGAEATGIDGYNGRPNYENAVLEGLPDIAELLVEYGAARVELPIEDRFRGAALGGDRAGASELLREQPAMIENPSLLMGAVHRPEAAGLLLELGADPNRPDGEGGRVLLHEAAWYNCQAVVECLLAAGARCDIREGTHHATPVGFANHAGHAGLRDLLLDHSHDIFDLAHFGRRDQIAALLEEDSALAAATAPDGSTPLDCAEAGGHEEVAALIRSYLDG
jgi:ankyrin repeat protein